MKFTLKGPIKDNIYNLMRKAGYQLLNKDEAKQELSFTRPSRGYPRFHIYLKTDNDDLTINLHLDQKKPSYTGSRAHSGEYDGVAVEEEVKRIKEALIWQN